MNILVELNRMAESCGAFEAMRIECVYGPGLLDRVLEALHAAG